MYALSKCLPFLRVATSGNGDDHSTTDKIEKLQPYTDDEEVALRFVQALCSSNKEERGVRAELHDIVNTSNFTESLAERILIGIIKVIQDGGKIGVAMRRAVTRSKETALKFAQKYPFYTALMAAGTLIALGVLVIYAPVWVLEALGFAARGPRLGRSTH